MRACVCIILNACTCSFPECPCVMCHSKLLRRPQRLVFQGAINTTANCIFFVCVFVFCTMLCCKVYVGIHTLCYFVKCVLCFFVFFVCSYLSIRVAGLLSSFLRDVRNTDVAPKRFLIHHKILLLPLSHLPIQIWNNFGFALYLIP